MSIVIREYQESDCTEVKKLIVYLQEFERSLEPKLKTPGKEIVDHFLERILKQNLKNDGILFVAILGDAVIGFLNAWIEEEPEEEQLITKRWLYISDLAVLPEFQGGGVSSRRIRKKIRIKANACRSAIKK